MKNIPRVYDLALTIYTIDMALITGRFDGCYGLKENEITEIEKIYRGYYTVVRRYAFYVRVARTILLFATRTQNSYLRANV